MASENPSVTPTLAQLTEAKYILGSTEGTYFYNAKGVLTDIRYQAVQSNGKSGVSFGLSQLDSTGAGKSLFEEGLAAAVKAGTVSQAQSNLFQTPGYRFTTKQLNLITKEVIPLIKPQIIAADNARVAWVAGWAQQVIAAVDKKWGSKGVFDPTNPGYFQAYGDLLSWINRTNVPTTLGKYLTGKSVTVNGNALPALTAAPDFNDLQTYLQDTKQFTDHPDEWTNVQGNIIRGVNALVNQGKSVEASVYKEAGPSKTPIRWKALVDIEDDVSHYLPADQVTGYLNRMKTDLADPAATVPATQGVVNQANTNNNVLLVASNIIKGVAAAIETVAGQIQVGGQNVGILLPNGGVVANGGWAIAGNQYGVQAQGGNTTVTNKGTITGTSGAGVSTSATGQILNKNQITGAVGVAIAGLAAVANSGSITGTSGDGADLGSGTVTNYKAGAIGGSVSGVVMAGASSDVVDSGSITGGSGMGVDLNDGGTVSVESVAGVITGGSDGVYAATGKTTVTNDGAITGTNTGVFIGGTGTVTNDNQIGGDNGVQVDGAGTLTNAGTIKGSSGVGVSFGDGGTVTNDTDDTIDGTSGGVIITGVTGQVLDSGTIDTTNGIAVELGDGGTVNVETVAGVITGGGYGVYAPTGTTTVTNDGSISGTDTDAVFIGGAGTVTNNDQISGASGVDIDGAGTLTNADSITATNGIGVDIGGGGTVTNDAGDSVDGVSGGVIITGATGKVLDYGTIDTTDGIGVELGDGGTVNLETSAAVVTAGGYGVYAPTGTTTVTNSGELTGTSTDGVFIGGAGTVTNNDQISGANGVDIDGAGTLTNADSITATGGIGVDIGGGGTVTNDAGDTIDGTSGGVIITSATGKVIDSGTIDTIDGIAVELGDGGTVNLDTSAAVASGGGYGVYAPTGTTTVTNDGAITGTDTDGVFIGGAGTVTNDNQISGDNGVDIDGAGTVTNADLIKATGGIGVDIGDGGTVTNDAGETIDGNSGGVIITGATGQVLDYGTIDTTNGIGAELGDGGTVDLETSATVITGGGYGVYAPTGTTTVTNDGAITGTDTDGVFIGGAGTVTNNSQISGDNGVDIDGAATVTNSDSITATGGIGVDIGDGGTFTNNAGDSVDGASGGVIITGATGQVLDYGTIDTTNGIGAELGDGGTVTLETSASVLTGGGYGVYAPTGTTTVTNDGSITGTDTDAVFIGGAGTVTNNDQISGDNGIDIDGAGTVTNADSITATGGIGVDIGGGGTFTNDAGDTVDGNDGGVIITGVSGKIVDSGTIDTTDGIAVEDGDGGTVTINSGATVTGGGYGVYSPTGATTVTNDGDITGTDTDGVFLGGNDSSLTNDGSITGVTGVVLEGSGSTFSNGGTIDGTGGIAVQLGEDVTLALGGGGDFIGEVETDGGPDDDTLELTDDGGTGDLEGLGDGGDLEAFDALDVDDDADWDVDGDNSIDSFDDDGDIDIGDPSTLTVTGAMTGSGTVSLSSGAMLEIGTTITGGGTIAFLAGALAETVKLDTATAPSATFSNFAIGDVIDLAGLTYKASYEAEWAPTAKGGTLEIIDTADGNAVVATLKFLGTYTGETFTVGADAGGTQVGLVDPPFAAPRPGDRLFTDVKNEPYSAYEEVFAHGALVDTLYDYTGVSGTVDGQTYDAYQVKEDANGELMKTTYYLDDGGHAIVGAEDGLTLKSLGDDTMTGGGSSETFVFRRGFGADEITDFAANDAGADHDVISLSTRDFASFAAVQSHAANVNGDVVITAANGDKLKLDGLTVSGLAGLAADFVFHG